MFSLFFDILRLHVGEITSLLVFSYHNLFCKPSRSRITLFFLWTNDKRLKKIVFFNITIFCLKSASPMQNLPFFGTSYAKLAMFSTLPAQIFPFIICFVFETPKKIVIEFFTYVLQFPILFCFGFLYV